MNKFKKLEYTFSNETSNQNNPTIPIELNDYYDYYVMNKNTYEYKNNSLQVLTDVRETLRAQKILITPYNCVNYSV